MRHGRVAVGLCTLVLSLMATTIGSATAHGAKPVLNVAHRGASGLAPEHTFAAYDLALRMGADYIEQDLQMTRDGVLVVLHDDTLDRTARGPQENCTGPVADKTLDQIKTCDAGSWFNEAHPNRASASFEGLEIPTLEEVFERYGPGVNYYIETKTPALYPGMEDELLRLLDVHELLEPARAQWRVLIQSFFPDSLEKIHARDPELPLIQLFPGIGSANVAATLDTVAGYAVGIGPSHGDADRALIDAAHERCLQVHPYTVNSSGRMRALLKAGVDGMFTNFPNRLDRESGAQVAPMTEASAAAESHSTCTG